MCKVSDANFVRLLKKRVAEGNAPNAHDFIPKPSFQSLQLARERTKERCLNIFAVVNDRTHIFGLGLKYGHHI